MSQGTQEVEMGLLKMEASWESITINFLSL